MKRALCLSFYAIVVLSACTGSGNENPVRFSDIQPELELEIEKMSADINIFEDVLHRMDASAKANQNYNEQKNIFLSSQLAIQTIMGILEYNRDLVVLFGDLREKNRKKFYEVRIESLESSINLIRNMHKQIQINYEILPPDFFEQTLVNTEHKVIISSIASLEVCLEFLKSVNQR
jgi:hypothetical protein